MNRRKRTVNKGIKEYIAPVILVIAALLFIIIIFNWLFGDKANITKPKNGAINTSLSVNIDDNTKAYIEYSGGKKKEIDGNITFNKGEKLLVKEGNLLINFPESKDKMNLNKLGELKYNLDSSFSLYSSDLWVEANIEKTIEARFLTLNLPAGSVASITQNDRASTVYLLKGIATITTNSNQTTTISKGQKITIIGNETKSDNFDIESKKSPITDFIKNDSWFLKNNAISFLEEKKTEKTVDKKSENIDYITIDSLQDEETVTTSTINISGKIINKDIKKITFNGLDTKINLEDKTFLLDNFVLSNKENDIVYKVYDDTDTIIKKGLFTVYYPNSSTIRSTSAGLENYSFDDSVYKFIKPSSNPYITKEDFVRIDGSVPVGKVSKILVNGYRLKKFVPNGVNWYYFANKKYSTLKDGINIYKVDYYGKNNAIIFSNAFMIIKEKTEPISKTKTIEK